MTGQFVSIVIPTLNEERYVASVIKAIAPKSPEIGYEILVLDGGSRDETCERVAELSRADARIHLIHNEKRTQSAALNLAAHLADPASDILIRCDCHADYPPGFVDVCMQTLREKQCQSVVVTMVSEGRTLFQKGAAAAQNSLLANGGSAHRKPGASRYVDHGHHAAFDRRTFLALNGYDESIETNEDVDFDARLTRAGGRIWLETSVPVTYFPRDTVSGLARQYFRYGLGRATTYLIHRYPLKLRQLLPVAFLLANASAIFLGLTLSAGFFVVPAVYLAPCFGWGIVRAIKTATPSLALTMGVAAVVMHHAWAAGFISGLVRRRPLATK